MKRSEETQGRASLCALVGLILSVLGLLSAPAQGAPLINYPDFSSVAGLQLNGTAAQSSPALRLTEAAEFQAASAFSTTAVNASKPWSTQFELSMHDSNTPGFGPADGMVFVLQPNSVTVLGEAGGEEGYSGITPSLGLEFDTYSGNAGDPPATHIGLLQNGKVSPYIECATENTVASPCEKEFDFPLYGAPVYAWVSYDGAGVLSVYASNNSTKPSTPLLQANVNLSGLGNSSFAGFTAATGSGDAFQEVLSWQFSGEAPPPPSVASITPSSGSTEGGAGVTIKGSGFASDAKVTIGGEATNVVVVSETEITATTTAGSAGAAEVVVSEASGTSTGGPDYTYLASVGPPHVESISPATGPTTGGTPVTIKGSGFELGATVTIGAEASEAVVVSENELTAKTPAESAGSHEVVVSESSGTSKLGPQFTYVVAQKAPSVESITPSSGPTAGGTPVIIRGSNFEQGSTVTISGRGLSEAVVVSESEITAKTPAGNAGPGEVVVSDASGHSVGGPQYTYVPPAPPTVTSILPTSGSTAGGTTVTIAGTGFLPGATVTIGNEASAVVVVSETEITARTNASAAGADEVVVTDTNGTSTSGPSFTYVPPLPPPHVTTIEPSEGSAAGGTLVTITGSGFLAGATVTIGAPASEVQVLSETEITAKTAPGTAGADEVIVTDTGGTSTAGPSFTYAAPPPPPPHVTSILPTSGSTAGGTLVTITGTGFLPGATVSTGAFASEVQVLSETEITAKTAPGAAGTDEVVVTDTNGASTAGPSFTYAPPPPPHVTSILPTSGSTAGGTLVTITGTGFLPGATVTIGAAASEVQVLSETKITAKTAPGTAGADEVVVSDTNGASTAGPSFTYVAPPPPPPHVTSILPTSGSTAGGTLVTITGTGFLPGATVTIGAAAGEVHVVSETKITAKTAPGTAGADEVVATDTNGTSTAGPSFTYVPPPPPHVTSILPTSGSTAGGTLVTITGTGFLPGATVSTGAFASEVQVLSETEITAKTAPGAAGTDEVVVTDTNGASTAGPSFTYVAPPPPPPHVTSILPTSGSTAGGTLVTITGTGFLPGATVTIGAAAGEVHVVSETKITAKTAPGTVGPHEVIVTDTNGTSTAGPSFTYVTPPPPPPHVTTVEPSTGSIAGGTTVTITGSGFLAGATVTLGATASEVHVLSETKLTARTAPRTAGTDEVVVSDTNGTSTAGPSFTYVTPPPPPPHVTSIAPTSGPTAGGTLVTITGTGFLAGATVTIGAAASEVQVLSETKITAKTAPGTVGPHEVIVTDTGGTSTAGPSFTYAAPPPPPHVTTVEPSTGSIAGGTTVTITGSGFLAGATVTLGATASEVHVLSETKLTAKTAPRTAGADEVIVTDTNGTSTAGPSFTYVTPPPHVTSIAPTSGPAAGGTAVTITGTGFLPGATVTIGAAASEVHVVSETTITAKTAAGTAGTDEVIVTDTSGASTAGPSFTYVTPPPPPPHVTSIAPTSGPTAGGTLVTITGTGFLAGATVTIGAATSEEHVLSETEITGRTNASAAGADEVIVTDTNGTSTAGPTFTYVAPPPPHVTTVKPSEGSTAGGTLVTITGTGFVPGATVTIGAATSEVHVLSETEITAKTGPGTAGADEVVVSDTNGTSTSGPSFTYVTPPPPPPHVTTVKPSEGSTAGGTLVTITGTGFLPGATVTIGAAASEVQVVSETEIAAKAAPGTAGTDEVIVTDTNGASTSGPSFTYVAPPLPPHVTTVKPGEGPTAGGTTITITGTGFLAGSTVTIGAATSEVHVVSETKITAKAAPGTAGTDEVIVTDTNGTSTAGPSFTYVAPPPPLHVTSIAPTSGSTAGGTLVTITGTGFLRGATVSIGAAASGVHVLSETEIAAKTAPGTPGADEVVVSDTNGTSTAGPSFTYVTPPPPPPHVTTVKPGEGSTAGGTLVTITGKEFLPGATVTIGAAASEVHVLSETKITAKAAPGTAGADEVVVSDTNGTSTAGPSFTYVTPPPSPPLSVSLPASGATSKSGVLGSLAVHLAPPTLAVTGNLARVSGSVLVQLPGSSVFVALTSVRQIPFGAVIDATHGKVTVTTAGPHGGTQVMSFYEGEFRLTQGRDGRVVATLTGGDFSVCPTARERAHRAQASSTRASRKHVVRKLWAAGHGSYSTKGNYAAGAVAGTRWLTEDRCDGTLIRVATDRVAVTNLVTHRHRRVTAGHSYLAKAP